MEKRVDGPLVAEELQGHGLLHQTQGQVHDHNERIMLWLTQTPPRSINLMIEGAVDGG